MRRTRSSLGILRRSTVLVAVLVVAPLAFAQSTATARPPVARETSFAATVARLSEPGGFFDTDNLISNESSYLHVLPRLRAMGVHGGAYIGVGPDQNYSYIATIRPEVAFIIDIRRDNMLQHLLFKALFTRSRNRLEFLCRWLGKPPPADVAAWNGRSIRDIIGYLDRTATDPLFASLEQRAVVASAMATGIPLSTQDQATISRFHGEFIRDGLELRFTSLGRLPRPIYPSLRQLILEKDLAGRQGSYLAREEDWRFVKSLHERDRIIPIVGDLAGTRAFPALAAELRARGARVSALYTSNVEYYLWRGGTFATFAESATQLPHDTRSVIIRSFFGAQYVERHPLTVDGYGSTQLLQSLDDFTRRYRAGELTSYWALVTLGARD